MNNTYYMIKKIITNEMKKKTVLSLVYACQIDFWEENQACIH